MLQRNIRQPGHLIVQHGVPVKKSAAAAVLTREANRVTVLNQTGIGQILGKTPIEIDVAGSHFLARLHDREHARMQLEVRRIGRDRLAQRPQPRHVEPGFDRF